MTKTIPARVLGSGMMEGASTIKPARLVGVIIVTVADP